MNKKQETNKKGTLAKFYQKNYKKFLILPILLLIFSGFMIFKAIKDDGTPIYRDISLKGGLSAILTVDSKVTQTQFENSLKQNFPKNTFSVSEIFTQSKRTGFIVDTDLKEQPFMNYTDKYFGTKFEFGKNYNSNFISPTLSSEFFKGAVRVLIISLVLMSIVIFTYFRQLVPSGAVVLSALFDIVVTAGILDSLKFKVSIAGIGSLLMIIGYSIDTDVLLTNRLIKEFGYDYFEKTFFAFKTGLLMTLTTFSAGVAALLITNSPIIFEIATILVIGLVVDFISTWFQNAGLLLWWLEKKEK